MLLPGSGFAVTASAAALPGPAAFARPGGAAAPAGLHAFAAWPEAPDLPGSGDAAAIGRIRQGDPDAFRALVQRHQARLYRYAVRMTGDRDAAMDLVQAAFIRAYERLSQCRDPDRFGHWVLAILANRCRQYARRRRNQIPLEEGTIPDLPAAESPAQAAERGELRALLARALATLPVEQREAFLLRHVEGLSYEDMASVTGASVPALRQRAHRAREGLGALLEESR